MSEFMMHHRTTTLEREFDAPPEAVFAAWADPAKRAIWNSPSDDMTIRYTEDDFSVGGKDTALCLAGDHILAEVTGVYHDIVADQRIVYTEVISAEGMRLGTSLVSVSFEASGAGTSMVLTLQTCALAGAEVLDEVAAGWTYAMEKMAELIKR
tara:strand:+ start:1473 stop:1931 length:459 start_codon:yes stop_codon:yes gene_type:complete